MKAVKELIKILFVESLTFLHHLYKLKIISVIRKILEEPQTVIHYFRKCNAIYL